MAIDRFSVISPVDGRVWLERPLHAPSEVEQVLAKAESARADWRRRPLAERLALLSGLVDHFVAQTDQHAQELAWQMGRPIRFGAGEVGGFEDRARHMIAIAPQALSDVVPDEKAGFKRFIRREPYGLVFVLSPWNYPYLTAVNAVVPALAAGNVVILKHSDQTPLCAERMVEAARAAGIPEGVFQHLHIDHDAVARVIADARVHHVAFTGSVEGGAAVEGAAAGRFIGMNLELGGKDAAYVRPDADLAFAAENVVEGVLFNSGQSCCGIERIYVHADVYDAFIEAAVAAAYGWTLGNPMDAETLMGPVVRARNADAIRAHVTAAIQGGARPLLDASRFPATALGPQYLAPQLLDRVRADMPLMRDETFGPVAGIQKVASDAEALSLINDSPYGLTASIWSADADLAEALGAELEVGTVFLNRCDYLDPGLAWTGQKHSGRGASLSVLGLHAFTRPKSYHLRLR